MRELVLVGIGTGNPLHLTRAGEAAIRAAEVILVPRKEGKGHLADLRLAICRDLGVEDRVTAFDLPLRDASGDYRAGVDAWHDAIAAAWSSALPPDAGTVALLVWGDPSLYDSTLRIAERLDPRPIVRVIPGITALQGLTAAHAIPLNRINAPVLITTGRRIRDHGWPKGVDRIAVLLDGETSFLSLEPQGVTIWWCAFLGMETEILIKGPLAEVAETIVRARAEARAAHGWIMDTYLLERA